MLQYLTAKTAKDVILQKIKEKVLEIKQSFPYTWNECLWGVLGIFVSIIVILLPKFFSLPDDTARYMRIMLIPDFIDYNNPLIERWL